MKDADIDSDPCYSVMVVPAGAELDYYPEDEQVVAVPEQVMSRILGVAKAYGLQFPHHAPENLSDRWVYSAAMIQWVIGELEFLSSLLNDDLVVMHIQQIIAKASLIQGNSRVCLAIEGP